MGRQNGASITENGMEVLQKIKNRIPYDLAITHLSICPKELKAESQRDICTPMCIVALFALSKRWKQPKCPSTDEWIKKMWYIHSMEYYSAIKRNEIGSFVEMWIDLEPPSFLLKDVYLGPAIQWAAIGRCFFFLL